MFEMNGMRAASSLNRNMRRVNRRVFNPVMLNWAGHRSSFAAVVHHVGRRSGREYRTPVTVRPIHGGFLMPLPYGEDTDWCRNVLARGQTTLEFKGAMVPVAKPEVMDVAVAKSAFPSGLVRIWHLFRIRRCLLVRREHE